MLPFTALRGLAAWWVAFYHFQEIIPAAGVGKRLVINGPLAVDLFFLMSGYVILLSNGRAFVSGVGWRGWLRFICIRLARVYPLSILMLMLFLTVPLTIILTGRGPVFLYEPGYFFASILLVQNWPIDAGLDWNVPAWSISTEMAFYIVFPWLAWMCLARVRAGTLWGILTVVLLGGIAVGYGGTSYTGWFNPARCVPECLLGMLLFAGSRRFKVSVAGAACLFLGATALIIANAENWGSDQATMPLAFFCLLWSLLSPRFIVSKLLTWQPLLWLGKLSFSTYMVHFFVKIWLKFVILGHVPDWTVFFMYVGLVLLVSVALYHCIEVPGRSIIRRWTDAAFAGEPSRMSVT